MNIEQARSTIASATIDVVGAHAAEEFLHNVFDGEDRGCCGFAWVTIVPKHKGNTKAGKEERKILTAFGFNQSYDKTFKRYSHYPVQSLDVLEAESRAIAEFLRERGFNAFTQSRMD